MGAFEVNMGATLHGDPMIIESVGLPREVELAVFIGYDGALVVQLDTQPGTGHIRVNVNDAPVFDGDPEG